MPVKLIEPNSPVVTESTKLTTDPLRRFSPDTTPVAPGSLDAVSKPNTFAITGLPKTKNPLSNSFDTPKSPLAFTSK